MTNWVDAAPAGAEGSTRMYARTQPRRTSRRWHTGPRTTGGGRLRTPAAVAAILVVLTSVGCRPTDPRSEAKPTASPSPSPATRVLDEADLWSVLLTAADLPKGYRWTDRGSTAAPTPSSDTSDPQCAKLVAELGPEVGYAEPVARVEVAFEKGEAGPALGQTLESHRNQAAVVQAIGLVRKLVFTCDEFTETVDDVVLRIRLTAEAFPALGDETFAVRFEIVGTGKSRSLRLAGYLVITRVGNTLNMIHHIGMPDVSAVETRGITIKAVDKLAPLAREPV